MLVVGGTYREQCAIPASDALAGSGLRAAAALRAVDPAVRLWSAVAPSERDAATVICDTLGVDAALAERNEPVGFQYFTPLSTPAISGRQARLVEQPSALRDDAALIFGTVEDRPEVSCARCVLDPQQPRELRAIDLGGLNADEIAIVVNRQEALALANGEVDAETAARQLLESTAASAVVVKRGPRGAVVATGRDVHHVGPRPTERVWPIGSGDAFAAGFAWAWGVRREDPVTATRIGGQVAAQWCSRPSLDFAPENFEIDGDGLSELQPNDARVYLAGPFFTPAQLWLVDTCFVALSPEVFSPFHAVGPGGHEVAAADLAGLDGCGALFALLDDRDPGTIFEAGWATAKGIPVVGHTTLPQEREDLKMLVGTSARLYEDLSTAIYQAVWEAMGWKDA